MRSITTSLFTVIALCFNLSAQVPGEWVWMKGSNGLNDPGVLGAQGVEVFTNEPHSTYMPVSWQDTTGNLWIYGGHRQNTAFGDLYRYNITTNNWTWMKGTGQPGQAPVYGTQGVPSGSVNPGVVRFGAATWSGSNNNFWLFGGYSIAPQPFKGDLWKYDVATNEWTWMKGTQQGDYPGNFGVMGVEDPANLPPAKQFCQAAWTDSSGNLWQFGGESSTGSMDDLWRYNITTNNWTWMKGSNVCCAQAVYGVMGVEDPSNTPGARKALMYWTDDQGMFWLFGDENRKSDLWRFNPATNNWAWMGGTPATFNGGSYGMQCVSDSTNLPPGRVFQSSCWTDDHGDFWMFGGQFFGAVDKSNDLWKYDVSEGEWMWVSGSSVTGVSGNYGTQGVSSPMNQVPSRTGSVGWSDKNGDFWIFGGYNANNDAFNDVWRFTPDTTCGMISTGSNEIKADDWKLFMNGSELNIIHNLDAEMQVALYNLAGQEVLRAQIPQGMRHFRMNIDTLPTGIYSSVLSGGNQFTSAKKVFLQTY